MLVAHVVWDAGGQQARAVVAVVVYAAVLLSVAASARVDESMPRVLLVLALAAFSVSSLSYTLVEDAAERFPSFYDVGLLAFYPLAFAAVVAILRRRVGVSGAGWLDAAIGAVAAASVGMAIVHPQLDGAGGVAVLGQLLYFLGDVGFVGLIAAAYALSGWRGGWSMMFLAAGGLALALGDALAAIDAAHATGPRPLSLLAWPAGVLLIATPFALTSQVAAGRSMAAAVGLPAASAAVCLPVVVLSPSDTPQHVIGSLGLVLVIARMALGLVENHRLLRSARAAAIKDPLTKLANRVLLLDRLEQAMLRRARRGGHVAVLFMDLDDFKEINDVHGHSCGDDVLVAVATRLARALRDEDTVARDAGALPADEATNTIGRLGGDEFVVVMGELAGQDAACKVAERLLASLDPPLKLGNNEFFLRASIGITVADGTDGRTAAELLRDADTAMYDAKRSGKGAYRLFRPEMHLDAVEKGRIAHDLRHAVERHELRLLYQPIVELRSGDMVGVEALVRWQHPVRGLMTPDRFIPLAERTGMIEHIDEWVMLEACRQMAEWDAAGVRPLHMSVNVSAHLLIRGSPALRIAEALRRTGAVPGRLAIEVTETVAVAHDRAVVDAINRVRAMGVRVAIDDFGMGHSALSRLHSFPVDRLKIDRSFISALALGSERGSIVAAMIAMAESLGLDVVAEGVENEGHRQALCNLGCELAQGYLFSRPVTPDEIVGRLRPPASTVPSHQQPAAAVPVEEQLVRSLLAELQRLTGLESVYLTHIDQDAEVQRITHASNTGALEVSEGLYVAWSDTVCMRALERGTPYTSDVPSEFSDSVAAAELALQTYIGVPVVTTDGALTGTLCGASMRRVPLGDEALQVMQRFARLIAEHASDTRLRDVAAGGWER